MKRYAEFIVRHRIAVIALTLSLTLGLLTQIRNLQVIIDPNNFLPRSHPYVEASNKVEHLFGSKYVMVIGLTALDGDAFTPHILEKVQRLTAGIADLPGVVRGNILSLAARKAKNIHGTDEGMEVRPLMETVPRSKAEIEALKEALLQNPAYLNTIVSRDWSTVAIFVEFHSPEKGFGSVVGNVQTLVEAERDETVRISVGGLPMFLTHTELFSQRMALLFPLAVLIIGFIHYEAFRTRQALVLPLVTALLAVIWGLGIMGLVGVPMDVFNATTPILILAVAAGHAVQILKRYYEEYHRLRQTTTLSSADASHSAVIESVCRVGPVMLTAGAAATLGFLSLAVFDIAAVRTFGIFTAFGIFAALLLEMTFIPALRSLLRPPGDRERQREAEHRFWDRLTHAIADLLTGPRRWRVLAGAAALTLVAALGASQVHIRQEVRREFFQSLDFVQDDHLLNAQLGGTNAIYLLVEGSRPDALKDPRVLQAMEATQNFLEGESQIGKTLSIADLIKRMNRAMHGDDPAWDRIPESGELISQYLLLYSMSGDPGDLDTYVDYDYQSANIWVFAKTSSSAYFDELLSRLRPFLKEHFGDEVQVSIGGSIAQETALNEIMIRSKLLNMAQIGSVILAIAALVFRSFTAGFLVVIPLVAAVLANFGIMGLTGIPLNIPNALTSAMAVGIGADYAIYLIYRLREELARTGDEGLALRAALTTAGKATLFVASAVAGGYGVLALSYGYYLHIWMAILIVAAMIVSCLSALTLLPGLIMALRPRFVFAARRAVPAPAVGLAVLCLLAASLAEAPPAAAQALSAREIMERNFAVSRVPDSRQEVTMELINKSGQRRLRRTFGATRLQDNGIDNMRVVRFEEPPDVAGTATLLIERADGEDDIWIYLPALRKVRRIVAANKKDSFVGTDFSYGDVIGHRVDDWTHRLLEEAPINGQPCYLVESLPRDREVEETSGYSKRHNWIRKDNFVTVRSEFWDRTGKLLKVATFADIHLVDAERNRWQAMRFEAANVQTGHRSVLAFENFQANQGISADYFTTRYLERGP